MHSRWRLCGWKFKSCLPTELEYNCKTRIKISNLIYLFLEIKPGMCPHLSNIENSACNSTCSSDSDCYSDEKCCPNQCNSKHCTPPNLGSFFFVDLLSLVINFNSKFKQMLIRLLKNSLIEWNLWKVISLCCLVKCQAIRCQPWLGLKTDTSWRLLARRKKWSPMRIIRWLYLIWLTKMKLFIAVEPAIAKEKRSLKKAQFLVF